MKLISTRVIRNSKCDTYSLPEKNSVNKTLQIVYNIANNNKYKISNVFIDEPRGMDSSWKHYEGLLMENHTEKSFIQRYQCLNDLEWITLTGEYEHVLVEIYVGREKIMISYPKDSVSIKNLKSRLVKFLC